MKPTTKLFSGDFISPDIHKSCDVNKIFQCCGGGRRSILYTFQESATNSNTIRGNIVIIRLLTHLFWCYILEAKGQTVSSIVIVLRLRTVDIIRDLARECWCGLPDNKSLVHNSQIIEPRYIPIVVAIAHWHAWCRQMIDFFLVPVKLRIAWFKCRCE